MTDFRGALRGSLVRNTLSLVTGTALTQVIIFAFSPVLSRLYSLEDFGNLANYSAWVTILALLSCVRYEHAIIVAPDEETTDRVLALTLALCGMSFLLYVAVAIGVYVADPAIGYLQKIHHILPFIPPGVLAICLSSPMTQINIKQGRFQRLAILAVVQMVFTVMPQVVLGAMKVPHGLIIGMIAGYAVAGAVLAAMYLRATGARRLRSAFHMAKLRATAAQYIDFPRYTLAADASTVMVQQFVPVFILALFNPALAGLYSFSVRIVRVPLNVIAAAVASALRRETLDAAAIPGGLSRLYRHSVVGLLALAAIPFVLILLFGPQIFALVYGAQWEEAGRLVQVLSPGILLEFVALPVSVFFLVTHTQQYPFRIQVAGFLALIAALVIGRHAFEDFGATAFLVAAVMIVVNLATLVMARRVASRADRGSGDILVDGIETETETAARVEPPPALR